MSAAAAGRCTGVLLAGGRAVRYGGAPKGLQRVGDATIAERALAALRGAADELLVVANDPRAPEWFPGLRVTADAAAGMGPLAGLETALRASGGGSVLVVAWDMPFVTVPLLRGLRALGDAGASAVVPRHGAGEIAEPLCAWYASSALPSCSALLAQGERSAAALAAALPGACYLGGEMLRQFGEPARLFLSVDAPDDLARIGALSPQEERAVRR